MSMWLERYSQDALHRANIIKACRGPRQPCKYAHTQCSLHTKKKPLEESHRKNTQRSIACVPVGEPIKIQTSVSVAQRRCHTAAPLINPAASHVTDLCTTRCFPSIPRQPHLRQSEASTHDLKADVCYVPQLMESLSNSKHNTGPSKERHHWAISQKSTMYLCVTIWIYEHFDLSSTRHKKHTAYPKYKADHLTVDMKCFGTIVWYA